MPSFPKLVIPEIQDKDGELKEVGQFTIETHPLGFRGALRKIKYFRNLLYSVPYITGNIPRFRLIVKHISEIGIIPFRRKSSCGSGQVEKNIHGILKLRWFHKLVNIDTPLVFQVWLMPRVIVTLSFLRE